MPLLSYGFGKMYSDEWRAAMTADSIEDKVEELAKIAESRANERGESIENVVHSMMHESYLMKHTTGDVLSELNELQDSYSEEFYRGEANEWVTDALNSASRFDEWSDFAYIALAAGFEWAVLEELDQK